MQVSGDVLQRIFDASPDALLAVDVGGSTAFADLNAEEHALRPRSESSHR